MCHSCPHKCVIPVPTSLSFLSPQVCHSWHRPGIQESPCIQACHSWPHKRVIPVPTSVSFLSPQACHSWHRPGIQESPCIQVCHSCPHKLVIPVPTSVSFLSPQACHSWRRPGIQESPCIQACHSWPHKLVIPVTDQESRSHPGYLSFLSPQACHSCPHKRVIPGTDQESRSHPEYKRVIPVPTSVSFLSPQVCHSWHRPGIQESPCIQVCHSCPHKLVIPGADQESRSHPVYKRVIPVPTSVSFLSPQVCHSWRRPGIQESPWIQVCHSCPHKRVIPVPTSVSFLAQTRNPGVTLDTSVSFLSPQACHSCPHKLVIPGADQESRSHPVYKCVIPGTTSLSFLAQTRNPGVTLYTSVSFLSPQVCHSWRRPGIQESLWIQVCHSCPHKRVIPVPTSVSFLAQTRNPGVTLYTSVSFLSPQACHSCPHKCVIPGADQESRSHPVYKRVIPVPTSVIPVPTSLSFLAQTRNPGVTLDTSVSFLSPQACHSCPHKCVIPGADQESRSHPGYKCVIPVPTSVSFLSPQACHSWHRPGIQESPWIQVCHSCPHKRVIPVADQESRSHSWRRPGILVFARNDNSMIRIAVDSWSARNPGVTLDTSVSFLSPQVCHSCPHKRVIPGADQESRSHPGSTARWIPGLRQE